MTEAAVTFYQPSGEVEVNRLSENNPDFTISYSIKDGEQTKDIYFFHPEDPQSDLEMHVQVSPDNYHFMHPIPPGRLVIFKRQSNDQVVFTIGHTPAPRPLPIDFSSKTDGRLAIG